jgi:hypothetical protein
MLANLVIEISFRNPTTGPLASVPLYLIVKGGLDTQTYSTYNLVLRTV